MAPHDESVEEFYRKREKEILKHSAYKVGDRITFAIFTQRITGTIIKVTQPHVRASDRKQIPLHYTVKGDTDAPAAFPHIVFPGDVLDGPATTSM